MKPIAMRDFRHLGWLLLLVLCGCEVDNGSPRATVRFTGSYRDGEKFAEGNLAFSPGEPLFGGAVAGMKRGERRRVEIPVPDCPGSPRFVEFGNPGTDHGVEEQFRYRRDRGPLGFDLELTELCLPTYWIFMRGSIFEGRYYRSCGGIGAIEPAPEPGPGETPAPRISREADLDRELLAASFGYGKDREVATVDALLQAGANPNATNPQGRSALALAAETGNRAIPRLLFLHGATLSGSKFGDDWGIHQAAADGQIEILHALLDAGPVDVNRLDPCGFTPLLWALRNEPSPLFECIPGFTRDYEGVLAKLLDAKADPRVRQGPSSDSGHCVGVYLPPGASPLHYAAAACYRKAVDLLLSHGAEVEVPDDIGDTPLMAAANAGCPEIVSLLLDRGARLDANDGHGGGSALVHAVTRDTFVQDNVQTVAILLKAGAKPGPALESLGGWLKSPTGRGFGRKGLESAREIERLLKKAA